MQDSILETRSHCPYCQRPFSGRVGNKRFSQARTKDHLVPKSKGGTLWNWACQTCNHIKSDMMPEEWDAYMLAHPKWWRPEVQREIKLQKRAAKRLMRLQEAASSYAQRLLT